MTNYDITTIFTSIYTLYRPNLMFLSRKVLKKNVIITAR